VRYIGIVFLILFFIGCGKTNKDNVIVDIEDNISFNSIPLNEKFKLDIFALYENGEIKDISSLVDYFSSDETLAMVDSEGIVSTFDKKGDVNISFCSIDKRDDGSSVFSKVFKFSIKDLKLKQITLSPLNLSLKTNQTYKLKVYGFYENNTTLNITDNIIYTSSNENVATVKNGVIYTKAKGNTIIKAHKNEFVSNELNLSVYEDYDSIVIEAPKTDFNVKQTIGKFNIRGSYARGFRAPSLKELYFDFVDINICSCWNFYDTIWII
jgi:hypothetical protein